jgi:RIO kinase 1
MTHNEHDVLTGLIDSFLDDSLILEVLEVVQSGKEATVFRCAAAPSTGQQYLAVKVYRPMERRSFRNDTVYQSGRVILNQRTRRAFEKSTAFGREAQQGMWVSAEYETQQRLYDAGADVPRPWACNGHAIAMEWLGDEQSAAVQLRHARLDRAEAHAHHETLLANIELMLRLNVVHADLSPFNVLYVANGHGRGSVKLIDVPQSVDPRANRSACDLLHRDVENVCRFFEKFGVRSDPYRIAGQLWKRFLYAEL